LCLRDGNIAVPGRDRGEGQTSAGDCLLVLRTAAPGRSRLTILGEGQPGRGLLRRMHRGWRTGL